MPSSLIPTETLPEPTTSESGKPCSPSDGSESELSWTELVRGSNQQPRDPSRAPNPIGAQVATASYAREISLDEWPDTNIVAQRIIEESNAPLRTRTK